MGALGEVKSLSRNFLHDGNSFSFQTDGFSFQARGCGSILERSVFSPAELNCKFRHDHWLPEVSCLWGD